MSGNESESTLTIRKECFGGVLECDLKDDDKDFFDSPKNHPVKVAAKLRLAPPKNSAAAAAAPGKVRTLGGGEENLAPRNHHQRPPQVKQKVNRGATLPMHKRLGPHPSCAEEEPEQSPSPPPVQDEADDLPPRPPTPRCLSIKRPAEGPAANTAAPAAKRANTGKTAARKPLPPLVPCKAAALASLVVPKLEGAASPNPAVQVSTKRVAPPAQQPPIDEVITIDDDDEEEIDATGADTKPNSEESSSSSSGSGSSDSSESSDDTAADHRAVTAMISIDAITTVIKAEIEASSAKITADVKAEIAKYYNYSKLDGITNATNIKKAASEDAAKLLAASESLSTKLDAAATTQAARNTNAARTDKFETRALRWIMDTQPTRNNMRESQSFNRNKIIRAHRNGDRTTQLGPEGPAEAEVNHPLGAPRIEYEPPVPPHLVAEAATQPPTQPDSRNSECKFFL